MKKTLIISSIVLSTIIVACSKTKVDNPFVSKSYSVTGSVTAPTGTATGSVVLTVNDDGSVMPQSFGAGLSSAVTWNGLATGVDSIVLNGTDSIATAGGVKNNVSIVLYSIKPSGAVTGTLNTSNYALPLSQKSTMLKGTWKFLLYSKGSALLTANLNQITTN
ncbi:hypothetical protein ACI6Q2_17965 [Chitinophagaceae bacterium LWZ2-11]